MECVTCSQKETKAIWSAVDLTIEEILRPANFKRFDLILNTFPKNISIPKMQMIINLIQITMHTWVHNNTVQFDKAEFHPTVAGSRQRIRDMFIAILAIILAILAKWSDQI